MIPDANAKQMIVTAYPDFANASPRVQQGTLAIARVLSKYGQPTNGDPDPTAFGAPPGGIDHNWGGFTLPAMSSIGDCPSGTYRIPTPSLGQSTGCIVLFDDDTGGINALLGAITNDAVVSQAINQGDAMALASALGGSGAFGPQSASVAGGSVNTLAAMLGNSVIAISTGTGQAPDWYIGKDRVDQSPALNSNNGGGQNTTTSTTNTTPTPAADAGTSPGKIALGAGVLGLIAYGLYKMSKAGPR